MCRPVIEAMGVLVRPDFTVVRPRHLFLINSFLSSTFCVNIFLGMEIGSFCLAFLTFGFNVGDIATYCFPFFANEHGTYGALEEK